MIFTPSMVVWLGMEIHLLLPKANKLLSASFGDLVDVLNAPPLTYTYQMDVCYVGKLEGGYAIGCRKGEEKSKEGQEGSQTPGFQLDQKCCV